MKTLYCLYLLFFWSSTCNNKAINSANIKIFLNDHGKQKELVLNRNEKQSMLNLIGELTNNYTNDVPLMVTEDKRKSILQNGKCIIIEFDPLFVVKSNMGAMMNINKILIPIDGELSSAKENKSCLFLLSNEKGYLGNAFNSPLGNNVLTRIKTLLKI